MAAAPDRFTVAEAAYVAGLPDKIVHREIDAGIVAARAGSRAREVRLRDVLYFAAMRDLRDELAPAGRERLRRSTSRAAAGKTSSVEFHGFRRPLAEIRREIGGRLGDIARLRHFIVSSPAVLGGEPVVKGTRVPARMVAELRRQGAPDAETARDYGLTVEQIAACVLFDRLTPRRGRPAPGRVVAEHVLPD